MRITSFSALIASLLLVTCNLETSADVISPPDELELSGGAMDNVVDISATFLEG